MKKVLVPVDDRKGSAAVLSIFRNLVRPPEEVLILHVERLEGKSLMVDMLGEAELTTLKESLKGTEHKEELDRKAGEILSYYKKELESGGLIRIRTIIREGIPADEIAKVAEEENVDLIIMGANGKKGLRRLVTGCVSAEVEKNTAVPVIMAKPDEPEKRLRAKESPAAV